MNKLINGMATTSNRTGRTFNGAKSNLSSMSACVDLFGQVGSMRARSDSEVISLFTKALAEDTLKAVKILFWARDIRGGAGERKIFRTITKYLANNHIAILRKNLHLFSEYGRWDDLVPLLDTPVKREVLDIITAQLKVDVGAKAPTLLAKWLPSINTSSSESVRFAGIIANDLGWSHKGYRKNLSALRKKINVLERTLCQGDWKKIDFSKVPSVAGLKLRTAFYRNAEAEYTKFIGQVEKGEKTIKASTLYPYDIVRAVHRGGNRTLDAQWKALPDYVEPFNGLVLCDTSWSMTSARFYGGKTSEVAPMDVAKSLSIYIAERNTGVWKDYFMPFSSTARLEKIRGLTITEKVRNLGDGYVGSTNLQAAFDLILSTAQQNHVTEDDMPKMLMVISDMQFNSACKGNRSSNFDMVRAKYRAAGYEMPQLVFWNVNAYGKDSSVTVDDNGTCLVSGCSPSILKSVLTQEVITPVDVMNQTIESGRYDEVSV